MNAAAMIQAAKAPRYLFPWKAGTMNAKVVDSHAFLFHLCLAGLHNVDDYGLGGYTVMDDSDVEIARHLNAVKHARGRILKTGLGLGCFVRMCLQKPEVEHIDVVEIDPGIIQHFGAEFAGNPRVTLHHADAFKFDLSHGPWDLAWHDIYCSGNIGLQEKHAELICRYMPAATLQGAWNLPRITRRRCGLI